MRPQQPPLPPPRSKRPRNRLKQRWRGYEIALLLLGVLVHSVVLVGALQTGHYWWDDSVQYWTLAHNGLAQGVFSEEYFRPLTPDLQHLPGYPAFLLLGFGSPAVTLVLQHGLVLATAYFLYKSLRRCGLGVQKARFAGFLWWVAPYPAAFASLLLTETLFIFCIVAGIYGLSKGGKTYLVWILSGLLLGLALLTKGLALVALLVGAILFGAQVFSAAGRSRVWQQRKQAAFFLVALLLLPLGWSLRHQQHTGEFRLARQSHVAFWYGRLGGALLLAQDRPITHDAQLFAAADSLGLEALSDEQPLYRYTSPHPRLGTAELHPAAERAGWNWFLEQPGALVQLNLQAFAQMLRGVGYRTYASFGLPQWAAWLLVGLQLGVQVLLLLLFVLSLGRIRYWPGWVWFALLTAVGFLVLHAAIWADGRYRLIADPLLLFAAFLGKYTVAKPKSPKKQGNVLGR